MTFSLGEAKGQVDGFDGDTFNRETVRKRLWHASWTAAWRWSYESLSSQQGLHVGDVHLHWLVLLPKVAGSMKPRNISKSIILSTYREDPVPTLPECIITILITKDRESGLRQRSLLLVPCSVGRKATGIKLEERAGASLTGPSNVPD